MPKQIMVVDDDPSALQIYGVLLGKQGYSVLKVPDGLTCLQILKGITPDLFILDVVMPEIDGIALCRILRDRPATTDTPILFVSAWGDTDIQERAYEAGADAYFAKPLRPRKLLEAVQSVLGEDAAIGAVGGDVVKAMVSSGTAVNEELA